MDWPALAVLPLTAAGGGSLEAAGGAAQALPGLAVCCVAAGAISRSLGAHACSVYIPYWLCRRQSWHPWAIIVVMYSHGIVPFDLHPRNPEGGYAS